MLHLLPGDPLIYQAAYSLRRVEGAAVAPQSISFRNTVSWVEPKGGRKLPFPGIRFWRVEAGNPDLNCRRPSQSSSKRVRLRRHLGSSDRFCLMVDLNVSDVHFLVFMAAL
ncbi:hypothetical protein NDU88_007648 [Pleurodeles waltl]|uniref:Uncharacterized protein n=1 Tax=Pleurodeles waltl TaxID=8319 RepID=A0AAV7QMP5_PLEWA|nr:hypothetical protein NDU88_007648 [Pleurodeles waltl]